MRKSANDAGACFQEEGTFLGGRERPLLKKELVVVSSDTAGKEKLFAIQMFKIFL